MASVSHQITVLQKDGKTTKLYQSTTANINEGDEHTPEHVLHHYTRSGGKHNGDHDTARFERIFGKNAHSIIKIERGAAAFVPPEVAALIKAGKLPSGILNLPPGNVANVIPVAKQATAPSTGTTTEVLPTSTAAPSSPTSSEPVEAAEPATTEPATQP